MAKRKNDEAPQEVPENKKRKQSLIENDKANIIGSDGLSQCFRRVRIRMHVSLAPAYASSPIDGIRKQHLDPLVLQYSPEAKGVVVAYTKLRILREKGTSRPLGRIMNESPFSFFWIACDLLVWSPQPGDVIDGWVSVQSPGHIALLIHDTFNASIKQKDIPANWEFTSVEDDENGAKSLGYWQDGQGQRIDGKLQFTVKKFLHGGRTVLVLGSLLTPDDVVPPQIDVSKHNKHEQHHRHESLVGPENGAENGAASTASTAKKIKFDD